MKRMLSTKSDKLDVQQTSQQPVVKQQNKSVNVSKDKVVATQTKVQTPSKVTNRNQAVTKDNGTF